MDLLKDTDLLGRIKNTIKLQQDNNNQPIVKPPNEIVEEAIDHNEFKDSFKYGYNRFIRRKLLSSKLEKDSCIVIFENTDYDNSEIIGGYKWKISIQKGIGKKYHKIFLDETSVSNLINSLDAYSYSTLYSNKIFKDILKRLIETVDNGIPVLNSNWDEFPGWLKENKNYLSYITDKTLDLPGVKKFQDLFTSDNPDIGNIIGPIDLFDGLDAILLKTFLDYNYLVKTMIPIDKLEDNNNYLHRNDHRIITNINNTKMPLVTVVASLISIYTLYKMYEKEDLPHEDIDYISIKLVNDKIMAWVNKIETKKVNVKNAEVIN